MKQFYDSVQTRSLIQTRPACSVEVTACWARRAEQPPMPPALPLLPDAVRTWLV